MAEDADTTYQTRRNLSYTERAVYEAARADALAERWRIEADVAERRGEPSESAREYQRQYEQEAAVRWQQVAALKAAPVAASRQPPHLTSKQGANTLSFAGHTAVHGKAWGEARVARSSRSRNLNLRGSCHKHDYRIETSG